MSKESKKEARNQKIVEMFYALKPYTEIAEKFGISKTRVGQIVHLELTEEEITEVKKENQEKALRGIKSRYLKRHGV